MRTGGSLVPIFGDIFGTGTGSGMALMIGSLSIFGLLIALSGYAFPLLRDVEVILPDHDENLTSQESRV